MGKCALMAKLDMKATYGLVTVHPQDYLGWEFGGIYILMAQIGPKGFHGACRHVRVCEGVEHQCNLDIMLDACCSLGVPFSKEKLEGSSSCIAFLSIEIDTRSGVLQLSVETLPGYAKLSRTMVRTVDVPPKGIEVLNCATAACPPGSFLGHSF